MTIRLQLVALVTVSILTGLLFSTSRGMADEMVNLAKTKDSAYQPVAEAVNALQKVDQSVEIVLFHGAWCTDSQREVPRFMTILELVDNPHFQFIEYEVNRKKQDVTGKVKEYDIQYVPTFIFSSNGKELGRIIERPEKSLEEDFARFISSLNSRK